MMLRGGQSQESSESDKEVAEARRRLQRKSKVVAPEALKGLAKRADEQKITASFEAGSKQVSSVIDTSTQKGAE